MIEVIPNWHPVAVHFTIALLITASALFAAGTLFRTSPSGAALTTAARWNLAIGIAVTVATLATGWTAYNTVAHDAASHANMSVHLRWAVATASVFLVAGGVAWPERRKGAGAGFAAAGAPRRRFRGARGHGLARRRERLPLRPGRHGASEIGRPRPSRKWRPPLADHAHDHAHDHAPANGTAAPDAASGQAGTAPAPTVPHDHANGHEHSHEHGQVQDQAPAEGSVTPDAAAGKAEAAPDAAAPHNHDHDHAH